MVGPSPSEREKMPEMWKENKDGKVLLLVWKEIRIVVREQKIS